MADTEVSLRVARPGDGASLLALLKKTANDSHSVVIPHLDTLSASEEDRQLAMIGSQENCLVLVAVLGSRVIGVVTIMPPADDLAELAGQRLLKSGLIKQLPVFTGELGIVVDPDFQGNGVGKLLVDEAKYWQTSYSRLDAIVLTVFNNNKRACALYHHAHFADVGQVTEMGRPATMMVWLPR